MYGMMVEADAIALLQRRTGDGGTMAAANFGPAQTTVAAAGAAHAAAAAGAAPATAAATGATAATAIAEDGQLFRPIKFAAVAALSAICGSGDDK